MKSSLGTLLLVFLLLCGFISCKSSAGPSASTNTSTASPADREDNSPLLSKAKTAEEATGYGISYLSEAKWEFDFVYLYSYLQPKFGWRNLPAQAQTLSIQDSLRNAGSNSQVQEFKLFQRLIDPQFVLVPEDYDRAKDVDAITVPALYCDRYPLDTATYFPVLRTQSDAGNYAASHALLAFIWAEEKHCLSRSNAPKLYAQIIAANEALLGERPIWTDLQLEAAALLSAAGKTLPDEWKKEVIALQNADGGWSDSMKGTQSDSHATILAMWFLTVE